MPGSSLSLAMKLLMLISACLVLVSQTSYAKVVPKSQALKAKDGDINRKVAAYGGGSGGGYAPEPSYGGGYEPEPSYGGGYEPEPSYGGGYEPEPSYGGGYEPEPSYGGGGGGYAPEPYGEGSYGESSYGEGGYGESGYGGGGPRPVFISGGGGGGGGGAELGHKFTGLKSLVGAFGGIVRAILQTIGLVPPEDKGPPSGAVY